MNRMTKLILIIVPMIVIGIFGVRLWRDNVNKPPTFKVYKNEEYGFEIKYPAYLKIETSFKTYKLLSNKWMAEAYEESNSRLLISIPIFSVSTDAAYQFYPYYFYTALRIGVSSDQNDIANFYNDYPDNNNIPSTTVVISGITFRKFIIQKTKMTDYLNGISYRTIHNGVCISIEQLETGSSYRGQSSPNDIPDSILTAYYNSISEIINSFTFTN